ncbi:MAG: alpha-hydroxy-acid oxidizing protein [Alphaproteobacteria bacterium]|nr:alpha-hydroxy-acid oxidizing protein [Alphaproteobacteria bacterium]
MSRLSRCFNIDDLRHAAQRRLPRGIFEYVDRGTEGETLLCENRAAFDRIRLRPPVLEDVSGRSLETTLFGKPLAMPMAIAPMSPAGLLWHEGELALARAAASAGIPYTLPTESMTVLERIAEAGGRLWFQLYLWNDRKLSHALLERVERAGFEVLVVTVDTSVMPNREFNSRNGFAMPIRPSVRAAIDVALHPRWLLGVLARYVLASGLPKAANHPEAYRNAIFRKPPDDATGISRSMSWDDLRLLRRKWPRPLIVKGILRADDARKAVDAGADGIVVSNHGARNFDSAVASIDALPAIADAVGDRATILLDSGIRRGSDVAKALALGAKAVLVGRPALWGIAVAGEAGAHHALDLLRAEFDKTLGFAGCRDVQALGRDLLAEGTRS